MFCSSEALDVFMLLRCTSNRQCANMQGLLIADYLAYCTLDRKNGLICGRPQIQKAEVKSKILPHSWQPRLQHLTHFCSREQTRTVEEKLCRDEVQIFRWNYERRGKTPFKAWRCNKKESLYANHCPGQICSLHCNGFLNF